jgi:integrase
MEVLIMQATTTREWILQNVSQLPEQDLEPLKDYLEFLTWKAQQREPEPKQTGKNPVAQKIIAAMKKPPHLTEEDIQALLQAIDDGKQPIRFESPFDGIDELEQQ